MATPSSPRAPSPPSPSPSPRVRFVGDPRFRAHRAPPGHPERPERLDAVDLALEALAACVGEETVERAAPRAAEFEELLRVHDERMLQRLSATRYARDGQLDADTYHVAESFDVAKLAAGTTIDLVRAALHDEAPRGFAAVRPPGHHAEANRPMGFCLLNNVAIATRAAQREQGEPRILIFDWDVHHGNGTQHLFEDDPGVLYLSTHQFPFYPGTGDHREAGRGPGLGATINVPMPAGCGDAEYVGVVDRIVVPAAIAFRPDLILVSCGFDAHRDDPLASMEVGLEGYRAMATRLRALADSLCRGRIVYVLEGGYSLLGVREGTRAVLESLVADAAPSNATPAALEPGSTLRALVDRAVAVHGSRIPDLGSA
ncbi:MAG: histone deacetylase [Deltaproteobacteria bacterium]|nr:histone deacetylase [Deltaproteobacteria bacterium]